MSNDGFKAGDVIRRTTHETTALWQVEIDQALTGSDVCAQKVGTRGWRSRLSTIGGRYILVRAATPYERRMMLEKVSTYGGWHGVEARRALSREAPAEAEAILRPAPEDIVLPTPGQAAFECWAQEQIGDSGYRDHDNHWDMITKDEQAAWERIGEAAMKRDLSYAPRLFKKARTGTVNVQTFELPANPVIHGTQLDHVCMDDAIELWQEAQKKWLDSLEEVIASTPPEPQLEAKTLSYEELMAFKEKMPALFDAIVGERQRFLASALRGKPEIAEKKQEREKK